MALLLFGAGAIATRVFEAGLYANAVLAALASIWIAAQLVHQPKPELVPSPASRDTDPAILALAEKERRMRAMLDSAPVLFLTLAPSGTLHAVNKAARTAFGTGDRILDPPPGLRPAIARAASGERVLVKLQLGGQAAERSHALTATHTIGAAGTHVLVVLTDMEAELHLAEATALRDMLQVLSHEIMNSLTPVTSLVESAHALLQEGEAANLPVAADALATALRRAQGIDRFVQAYRAMARLPAPVLKPCKVRGLLQEAAVLFRARWAAHGVVLTVNEPAPEIVVQLDADLMLQALLNLMTNAAEAALSCRSRAPQVVLSACPQASGLVFRVSDSGEGVPSGQEETIFRPFFTSKDGGTGLGLSLARQIALSHGGSLTLQQPGLGELTTFLLET
jgi:signal transduction histidine kinase